MSSNTQTPIDWSLSPEGDPTVEAMADAAEMNSGLPHALFAMALVEVFGAGWPADVAREVTPKGIADALADICKRYVADEFTGY